MRDKLIKLVRNRPVIIPLIIFAIMTIFWFLPEISLFRDAFVSRSWKTAGFAVLFLVADISLLCVAGYFAFYGRRR
jgi:hypothetical protein